MDYTKCINVKCRHISRTHRSVRVEGKYFEIPERPEDWICNCDGYVIMFMTKCPLNRIIEMNPLEERKMLRENGRKEKSVVEQKSTNAENKSTIHCWDIRGRCEKFVKETLRNDPAKKYTGGVKFKPKKIKKSKNQRLTEEFSKWLNSRGEK